MGTGGKKQPYSVMTMVPTIDARLCIALSWMHPQHGLEAIVALDYSVSLSHAVLKSAVPSCIVCANRAEHLIEPVLAAASLQHGMQVGIHH